MFGTPSHSSELRPRFRSFKYSISRKTSHKKQELFSASKARQRESIINPGKLDLIFKQNNTITQSQTLNMSIQNEDNLYVKTFTTFFSREYPKDIALQDKENMRFKVLIPEYDYSFDEEKESDFTFFDTMTKPVNFIEVIDFLFRGNSQQLKKN